MDTQGIPKHAAKEAPSFWMNFPMKGIGTALAFIATFAFMATPAKAGNDTGDELYASLKRFVDSVEGHPPSPDEAKDFAMAQSLGYVLGVWDGIMIQRVMDKKDTRCMPPSLSNVALSRTILKHIDAKPGDRSIGATYVVANAILDAYPCLKTLK
ncbi:Rap1a/Tai family immunity protein [Luteibacter sp. CQ10]|uniref:Rap1a/Tai family immunity protein n=1 Tax=Luteibacter sp. CQ10 TaxID=2805821 RepID=UPI0034A20A0D